MGGLAWNTRCMMRRVLAMPAYAASPCPRELPAARVGPREVRGRPENPPRRSWQQGAASGAHVPCDARVDAKGVDPDADCLASATV